MNRTQEEIDKTIITVGELITVLKQFNLTARVVVNTCGSYCTGIQLSRDDIAYDNDDDEDTVVIVI